MLRLHYYNRRGRGKHTISFFRHISTNIVLPVTLLVLLALATSGLRFLPDTYVTQGIDIGAAFTASSVRLFIAYVLSLCIGVPLALIAVGNRTVESILLPIYDVLESLPILAFFPLIILFFVDGGMLEGAAIFIIFFSMIWNVVFNVIAGYKAIPRDIFSVGRVFGLSARQRFFKVTLPALFPSLVTASILSIAEGWNILIVAEALHAYAPQNAQAEDLYGIGSMLVHAVSVGDQQLLIAAISSLIVAIALINIFLWQPLLARSTRYKFE